MARYDIGSYPTATTGVSDYPEARQIDKLHTLRPLWVAIGQKQTLTELPNSLMRCYRKHIDMTRLRDSNRFSVQPSSWTLSAGLLALNCIAKSKSAGHSCRHLWSIPALRLLRSPAASRSGLGSDRGIVRYGFFRAWFHWRRSLGY